MAAGLDPAIHTGGRGDCTGRGSRPEPVDELLLERLDERRQLLLDELAAARVVDTEGRELRLDVTGADADDGATAREVVEGLELLGRDQRVAVREHVRVREEVGALG